MKKILSVAICMVIMLSFSGCNSIIPEESYMRKIFRLATMECKYNVVVRREEKNEGLIPDKEFWVEYEVVAKYGIDVSKVKIEIYGKTVKITMPKAELFPDLKYVGENKWYDDTILLEPDKKDIGNAIKGNEQELKKNINDEEILEQAQKRAQVLIENYIKDFGEQTGTDYTIKWVVEGTEQHFIDKLKSLLLDFFCEKLTLPGLIPRGVFLYILQQSFDIPSVCAGTALNNLRSSSALAF